MPSFIPAFMPQSAASDCIFTAAAVSVLAVALQLLFLGVSSSPRGGLAGWRGAALRWQLAVGALLPVAAAAAHALLVCSAVPLSRLGAAAVRALQWPPAAPRASRWAMPAAALLAGAGHASLAGGVACSVLGVRGGGSGGGGGALPPLLLLRCGVAAAGLAVAAASAAAVRPLLQRRTHAAGDAGAELLRAVGLLRSPLAAHGALALAVALLLRRCRCA